jgi:serine/threonine protein kinase
VKPENLLLQGDTVVVGDFGLAKQVDEAVVSHSGEAWSLEYAAPEWFKRNVTTYSDQYSLAVTYFELRTGYHIFRHHLHSRQAMQEAHQFIRPDLRELPFPEAQVLERALAKEPKDRYPTCGDFVRNLRAAHSPPPQRQSVPFLVQLPWDQPGGALNRDILGLPDIGAIIDRLIPRPSQEPLEDPRGRVIVRVVVEHPSHPGLRPEHVQHAKAILRCEFPKFQTLDLAGVPRGSYIEFIDAKVRADQSQTGPFDLLELITERQVRDSFLLFPKVAEKLNSWLQDPRDLMFLGLAFCGKTTLLRFLFFELPQLQQSTGLAPFYLWPQPDLTDDKVPAAVDQLEQLLHDRGWLKSRPRTVLLIDNVHTHQNYQLAKQLMKRQPRRWLVWGAARAGELQTLLRDKGEDNPWEKEGDNPRKEVVRHVCDLAGEREIDYLIENRLREVIRANHEENYL